MQIKCNACNKEITGAGIINCPSCNALICPDCATKNAMLCPNCNEVIYYNN